MILYGSLRRNAEGSLLRSKTGKEETRLIKGYSEQEMTRIALGTHLGDVSDEVSEKYRDAISFALQNGIGTIDGAINYRGMRGRRSQDAGKVI